MSTEELKTLAPKGPPTKVKGDINAYVVVAVMIFLAAVATWVIPAGAYERVENPVSGVESVVPGTFQSIDGTPVGPWEVWLLIQEGLADAGTIIFFILIVGGCFGLISQTGAITALIARVVTFFQGKKYEKLAFVAVFGIFFTCSATFGFGEQAIIFVPFIVMMAIALGYDAVLAVAVVVCATALGYAGSITGPFNVAIAQDIAGLPLYSGYWFRLVSAVVIFGIAATYILRYARKIKRDPSKSLVAHIDFSDVEMHDDPREIVMTGMHKRVLITFLVAITFMIFSMMKFNFTLKELTGYFLLVTVVIGIVALMRPGDMADSFLDGARALVYPALLVGFARSIQVILESGGVLDSIVNGLVQPLSALPVVLVPGTMILVQSVINLFIPAASAMAVVTMPIMSPLADLLEIQRQTAVLAYQFGDGITNLILPSYPILMAALGLARVPFGKWFRFSWPLVVILLVTVFVLGTIAELVKVGPF